MDVGTWAAFLGASVLLTLMPGPDILFVITQSIAGSRKDGSAVGLGLCTGLLVHIAAAALGVSAVVYRSEFVFQTVKVLGALYLFYLAWQSWLTRARADGTAGGEQAASSAGGSRLSFGRLYRRGILMNVMNPKVSLFFVAFLPQFVVPDGTSVPLQMIALGALFLLQACLIFQIVALLAGRIGRTFVRRAASGRAAAYLQTAIYAVLGAQLLFFHLI